MYKLSKKIIPLKKITESKKYKLDELLKEFIRALKINTRGILNRAIGALNEGISSRFKEWVCDLSILTLPEGQALAKEYNLRTESVKNFLEDLQELGEIVRLTSSINAFQDDKLHPKVEEALKKLKKMIESEVDKESQENIEFKIKKLLKIKIEEGDIRETIDAYISAIRVEKETSVDWQIERLVNEALGIKTEGVDKKRLILRDVGIEVLSKHRKILEVLDEGPDSLEEKYKKCVIESLGIKIGIGVINSVVAEGNVGEALDSEVEGIANEETKEAIKGLIKVVREREVRELIGLRYRFESAEKRISEFVKSYQERAKVGLNETKIVRGIKETIKEMEDACSVGLDFRLINELEESLLKATGVRERNIRGQVRQWCLDKVQIGLIEAGLGEESSDVHHINQGLRILVKHMRKRIPEGLIDRYRAAKEEQIEANKEQIVKTVLKPWQLIEMISKSEESCEEEVIEQLQLEGYIEKQEEEDQKEIERIEQIISLVVRDYKEKIETKEAKEAIEKCLIEKGLSHGIKGVLAKSGISLRDQSLELTPEDLSKDKRDTRGMSFLGYVVLGGNVDNLDNCKEINVEKVVEEANEIAEGRLSLLELATESGSEEMFERVYNLITLENRQRVMEKRSERDGATVLMRGILSRNKDLVTRVLSKYEGLVTGDERKRVETVSKYVNQVNEQGQNSLILGVETGNTEIVMHLIEKGADLEYRVPDSRCRWLELAILKRFDEMVRCVCMAKYTRRAEVKALLKSASIEEGVSTAFFLVRYKAVLLAEMLKGTFSKSESEKLTRKEIVAILSEPIENLGYTIAHWMVEYEVEAFKSLLLSLSEEAREKILQIEDINGDSVATWMAKYEPEAFKEVLLSMKSDARIRILIRETTNWIECTDTEEIGEFKSLILDNLKEDEIDTFLSEAVNKEGDSIVNLMAMHRGKEFKEWLLTMNEIAIERILMIQSNAITNVAHILKLYDEEQFQELMVSISESTQKKILKATKKAEQRTIKT